MSNQIIAEYNGVQFPFPAGTAPATMLSTLKVMYPELERGGYREEAGKTVFFVVAQNKSADQIIAEYNGVQFPFPAGTAPATMLSTLKVMYPELERGGYREESGKTVFFVVAQNKSAGEQIIAEYNGVQFPFPAGTAPATMLSTLKVMYPELERGGYREEAGKTVFFVVAQNKSAQIIAEYNGVQFPFPAGTAPATMLSTLKVMYPELERGGYREEAGKTVFFVVAQNKSAQIIAEYNGVQFPFPAGTAPATMLSTLKVMYPELERGGYREEAGKTVFFVVAQNKSN